MSTPTAKSDAKLPATLEEHLNETTRLLIEHAATLLPLYLLLSVPGFLAAGYQQATLPETTGWFDIADALGTGFLWGILIAVLQVLPLGLVTVYVARRVFGEQVSPSEALSKAADNVIVLLLVGFLVNVVVGLGTFALVIPGIAAATFLSFAVPAVLLDEKSPFDALKFSFELVKNQFWRVLGFTLLVSLLAGIFVGLVGGVFGFLFGFAAGYSEMGDFSLKLGAGAIGGIFGALGAFYQQVFLTLFYLSSKRRFKVEEPKKPVPIRD